MTQMTEIDIEQNQPAAPELPEPVPHDEPAGNSPDPLGVVDQVVELGETVGHVRCDHPFVVAEDVNVYYGDN
ncbi:MAG: hypothetical protein KJO82_14775, partial [Gammaproteobacteria bacterium]|nr:hypothetical protein [Gammaproteobacteria bacterium]